MMKINVIAVGNIKEAYLTAAIKEYEKRLGAFCDLNIIELAEARLPGEPSQKEIEAALSDEGKRILSKIVPQSLTAALCIEGREYSSVELSKLLESSASVGKSKINFIIGSSYGLSDEVKSKADIKLSMSKMTFPHQLARVMLLEQIYRAETIINHRKYHK